MGEVAGFDVSSIAAHRLDASQRKLEARMAIQSIRLSAYIFSTWARMPCSPWRPDALQR